MHLRKNAIYQDICGGQHREHLVVATIPMEANLYQAVKAAVPTVVDVHVPAPFCLIVSIKKRFQGQAQSAMIAAFAAEMYLKNVIVVDDDVDVTDLQQVIWAVATRTQAEREMLVSPGAGGHSVARS